MNTSETHKTSQYPTFISILTPWPSAFCWLSTGQKDKAFQQQDIHFPMGGHRFRVCLEDVVELVIREFGVEVLRELGHTVPDIEKWSDNGVHRVVANSLRRQREAAPRKRRREQAAQRGYRAQPRVLNRGRRSGRHLGWWTGGAQ